MREVRASLEPKSGSQSHLGSGPGRDRRATRRPRLSRRDNQSSGGALALHGLGAHGLAASGGRDGPVGSRLRLRQSCLHPCAHTIGCRRNVDHNELSIPGQSVSEQLITELSVADLSNTPNSVEHTDGPVPRSPVGAPVSAVSSFQPQPGASHAPWQQSACGPRHHRHQPSEFHRFGRHVIGAWVCRSDVLQVCQSNRDFVHRPQRKFGPLWIRRVVQGNPREVRRHVRLES